MEVEVMGWRRGGEGGLRNFIDSDLEIFFAQDLVKTVDNHNRELQYHIRSVNLRKLYIGQRVIFKTIYLKTVLIRLLTIKLPASCSITNYFHCKPNFSDFSPSPELKS